MFWRGGKSELKGAVELLYLDKGEKGMIIKNCYVESGDGGGKSCNRQGKKRR